MKLKAAIVLCLLLSIGITAYAGFWSSGIYPVSKLGQPDTPCPSTTGSPTATPSPSATATATPTATATGTPGPLPAAITAMLGDVGNGSTNPIPTMCAAPAVVSVGSTSGGNGGGGCITQGSASVANIPTNGNDASSALRSALLAGDVNLPANTYTINSDVIFPSWRTLQCQPGAVLTTTATTLKMLSFNGVSNSTVVGCTFRGTGASVASSEYATFVTGGQNINFIGNTVTGFPATSAVTFSAANNDVVEMNLFSGNHDGGLLVTGSTHISNVLNNTGTLSPRIPAISNVGGTTLQHDLWAVLAALGASGTPAANNYSLVAPGAVFGGATCHGDGATDDTACIQNALSAGSTGIILTVGTGANPYFAIGGTITGTQLNGKTILCQPGARILDITTNGSGGTPKQMFNSGWGGVAAGSNFNFIGCQMYGLYVAGPGEVNSYNELVEMGGSTSFVQGIGLEFRTCWGDCWITYSPCGVLNNICGNPATSGPNDIGLTFSTLYLSDQSAVHINGGQNMHVVFDKFGDSDVGPEVDDNVMQVEAVEMDNVFTYTIGGEFDTIGGFNQWVSSGASCEKRQNVGNDYSNCNMHDVLADGEYTTNVHGTLHYPTTEIHLNEVKGITGNTTINCIPGNHSGNGTINGGVTSGGDC